MTNPSATSGASGEATVEAFTMYGCRCGLSVLDRLMSTVGKGFAPNEVTLQTTWRGKRITQNSLSAIRGSISRAAISGHQGYLTNLRIEVRDEDRFVMVDLSEEAATITVESTDEAWALGRAEQIRRILQHAGGRAKRRSWRPWLLAIASGGGAVAVALLWFHSPVRTVAIGAVLAGGAGAAVGFLIGRWIMHRSRPVIWIDGPVPRHAWQQWAISERLAAVGLLIALIGLVVQFLGVWRGR